MNRQALFYEKVVPLSQQRHGRFRFDQTGYQFARQVNAVLLAGSEFEQAVLEYPIVFVEEDNRVRPAVVLGLRPGENLFIDESGNWISDYVPAYVRRYPFIFFESPQTGQQTVCIDELCDGFNLERGDRLFLDDGALSQSLQERVRFLLEYQQQWAQTEQKIAALCSTDLLEPMQANVTLRGDERLQLQGFMVVNQKKFSELEGEQLAELHSAGALELIYQHLSSLKNFKRLVDLCERRLRQPPVAQAKVM